MEYLSFIGNYKNIPKVKIILYNFEKLSGFKFEPDFVKKLVSSSKKYNRMQRLHL